MNILFIGDINAKEGRRIVSDTIDKLINEYDLEFVIANAENASGGKGITPKSYEELIKLNIDVLTSGNHIYKFNDIFPILNDDNSKLIRPLNYPEKDPGRGFIVTKTKKNNSICVINLIGRVFMEDSDCPFRTVERCLINLKKEVKNIFVDIHSEATSEKLALAHFLDGKVSGVIGTHTHVQTADERILPNKTAYITDAGMTGSMAGVIGVKKELAITRFLTQTHVKFEPSKGEVALQGVIVDVDEKTGHAQSIKRLSLSK
jgi:metallophosphoesterase (TIGR00282 family)